MNKIKKIIFGNKRKIITIIGPCSFHNYISFNKYSKMIIKKIKFFRNILIILRVYLEKPRTINGWKGFIYDPDINYSYDIKKGIRLSKKILSKLYKKIYLCTEILNPYIYNIIKKYISIGTIGARTAESQIHREISSENKMIFGFKNRSDGNFLCSINSLISSSYKNPLIYNKKKIFFKVTKGNNNCFIILRGGLKPNYKKKNIKKINKIIKKNKIKTGIMIDISHDNSKKNFKNQKNVFKYLKKKLIIRFKNIIGIMLESNVSEGSEYNKYFNKYKSITDSCISLLETFKILFSINKFKSL
ncbi:3-deoxy-7-phosphoheptulonate synthase [Candidatus Vidania fulgoroideorum]